jgi:hypothetical protein
VRKTRVYYLSRTPDLKRGRGLEPQDPLGVRVEDEIQHGRLEAELVLRRERRDSPSMRGYLDPARRTPVMMTVTAKPVRCGA